MKMASISRRAMYSTVAAFAFMCTAATVIVDNAKLAGEYTLNESKSELGQFGARMAAKTLKIEQTASDISVSRTNSFNGEDRTTSEKLAFDGKETESTVFGNSKKKSTAKWSDDGKTFNINSNIAFDANGQTMEIKSTETYKL